MSHTLQKKSSVFITNSRLLTHLYDKPFENIVGNGEVAGNQHFLLFPQCFSTLLKTNFNFSSSISAKALNLDQSKFLSFGNELNVSTRGIDPFSTEPRSSVGSVANLRTGGRWFDPRLGQYSFRGLDSFLSHHCPLFRLRLCGKAASGLKRILCGVLVKATPGKHGKAHWLP